MPKVAPSNSLAIFPTAEAPAPNVMAAPAGGTNTIQQTLLEEPPPEGLGGVMDRGEMEDLAERGTSMAKTDIGRSCTIGLCR